ncbi:hypothetical protein MMC10_006186 [Thelotrema lepadinum]|nr:hypothetical protein [Thelotrema lepadinum]
MSIKTVLLIGAGGSLGAPTLAALTPLFTTTVLTRESSKSTFPSDIRVITVPDSYPEPDLVAAFKGQDAVVSTIGTFSSAIQTRFADAAVAAGVKRFIPAEFGSDTEAPGVAELLPSIWGVKKEALDYVKAKAAESEGKMSWSAIGCGAYFDWAFTATKGHFAHLDLTAKKAMVFDDGEAKFSVSNLSQVAKAVAQTLVHAEETRDRFVFVQSFLVTQNELVAALEKVTGDKFEVTREDSRTWMEVNVPKAKEGDMTGVFNTIWGVCVTDSDFTKKVDFANGMLGLEDEDLEESLRAALKKM